MQHIVLAVEAGADDSWLADPAADVAKHNDARVSVVSVDGVDTAALSTIPRSESLGLARSAAEAVAERLRADGVEASAHALSGRVVPGILLYAEEHDADLILVGGTTRGRVARRLLGSVSLELAGRARRPVLVITPPTN